MQHRIHHPFKSAPRNHATPSRFPTSLACFALALAIVSSTHADGVIAGPRLTNIPGVDHGSLLIGELNCTACHLAQGSVKDHIIPRLSPRLGNTAMPLTPQGLREFLTDPQAAKPGTTMPDLLHQVPDRAGTIDALVHFLYSYQVNPTNRPVGANDFLVEKGKTLYHQVGCVACHAPQEPAALTQSLDDDTPQPATTEILARLQRSSVPFGNLARKTTVPALAEFLMDPLKSRPSGRMPALNLSRDEATAIAVYLLRQQAGLANPDNPPARIAGLQYQYFEQSFSTAAKLDEAKVHSSGVVPRFEVTPRKRDQSIGFRFTGSISLPTEGDYTFFIHSDDGSILWINGKVIANNDGDHGGSEKSGKIRLPAGDHAIRVTYYNNGGPHEFRVSYQGPGIKKQEIPSSVLTHFGQPMIPLGQEQFTVDPAKALRGRSSFVSLGCNACHQVSNRALTPTRVRPLHHINPSAAGGCLNQPTEGRPKYALSDPQHAAIVKTLQRGFNIPVRNEQKVAHTMAALNCYACHSRDGIGGPNQDRAHYFRTDGEVDLGDEGRIPPHLSGVGTKLKLDWFKQVLMNKTKVRPYMATRMPQFGKENVSHLPSLFAKTDLPSDRAENRSATDAKYGRNLVGTGGLSCVACHTYGNYASLGIPAMDLTVMTKRLRQDWFYRYLRNPASLRPGTRMPSFWPDGQAANQDILNGDTDRQIHSIWAFLSQGGKSLPPGLVQGKEEIFATDEAVIYRHFISGAGTRAIGVGYPQQVNLAFDANDIRLALIWQGAFIDAAKHRSGRGAGSEQPLGYNVLSMTPGAPFAILPQTDTPWPAEAGRDAHYKMRGYRLDEQRRPAFLYSFNDIQIEDYPINQEGELDGTLKRTFSIESPSPVNDLWFRAWIGTNVKEQGNNTFLVDDSLTLRFTGTDNARLRTSGNRTELLVPVPFKQGKATFVEELLW